MILTAAAASTGAPSTPGGLIDSWFEYGVVGLVILTLLGLIAWLLRRHEQERRWLLELVDRERARADAERTRAGQAHDQIINMVERASGVMAEQVSTNRSIHSAVEGTVRAVDRLTMLMERE